MKTVDLSITKNKIVGFVVVLCTVYYAGYRSGNKGTKIEYKEKIVTVQEKVKTKTKIVENPDGTKVTTIVEDVSKNVHSNQKDIKISKKEDRKWLVDLKASSKAIQGSFSEATYTLGLSRKVLPNAYLGVYGNTSGVWGIGVTISF